jgi:hypothetical protein
MQQCFLIFQPATDSEQTAFNDGTFKQQSKHGQWYLIFARQNGLEKSLRSCLWF